MKKTLFLAAAGLLGLCFQAQAITVTSNARTVNHVLTFSEIEGDTGTITLEDGTTAGTFNKTTGVLSDYDVSTGLTITLNKNSEAWVEDTFVIYNSANPDTGKTNNNSCGFIVAADGGLRGSWSGGKWTDNNKTEDDVVVAKNSLTDTVTVKLHTTQGVTMTDSAGTQLYRAGDLKASGSDTMNTYINQALVSAVTVNEQIAATEFYVSAGDWEKTFASSAVAVLSGTDKHEIKTGNANLGKGSIVVSGTSQMFLQAWQNGGKLTVADAIYIGGTSYSETGDGAAFNGVALRFGNESFSTELTGALYVVEDAHIKSGKTLDVIISGKVTDIVDNVDTGSTLTVSGQGIQFTGEVDLKGMVVNNGTSFSNKVTLENMTAKGGVSFGGATNIGTLNLASGLSSTSAAVTTTGALTLGNISLNLTGYNTGIYTLVNATGEGSSITWDANAGNAWSKTGLGEGLMASVGFVGENSKTLQLSIANAITTTSVTGYSLNEAGTALTLNVEEAVLMEGMVVNVNLLTDDLMQAILADMKAIQGAISEDGKAMVSITLAGSVSGTITADTLNEVVFVKGDTGQSYWGEMVGNQLMYNVERIPEPASATLSLAALMMLCARRRRRA